MDIGNNGEQPTAPLVDDNNHSSVPYNDMSNSNYLVDNTSGVGSAGSYDEDMEPWLEDVSLYNFYCHSIYKQSLFCLGNLQWDYSIYHLKNSNYLTFKKRDFLKTRPKTLQNFAIGFIIFGIFLIFITDLAAQTFNGFGLLFLG